MGSQQVANPEKASLEQTSLEKQVFSSRQVSVLVHLSLFLFFWGVTHRFNLLSTNVEITMIDSPSQAPSQIKPVALEKPRISHRQLKQRAVFGVSRPTSQSQAGREPSAADVSVKVGNTIAKAPDSDVLKPEDSLSLPIPADEYLVTEMPKLLNEYRIPYPPEAKAKGIQGAVVMELLIDFEGRVRDVKLLAGPGSGLDQAALQAVQEFRFAPAKIEDKAVSVKIRYAYRFVLEK